jgi:hypothetical protein
MKDIKIETGVVRIGNKEYKTVALRVGEFREAHPDWTIETELVSLDEKTVVMRALIKADTGRLISTGYAEESRTSSQINKTSALENCETSAVGRALAFFGLAGSEIASADEVAAAIGARASVPTPVDITEALSVIDAAPDMESLKAAYTRAYDSSRGNPEALAQLTAAKDKRKRVLTVTGVFSGHEVQS